MNREEIQKVLDETTRFHRATYDKWNLKRNQKGMAYVLEEGIDDQLVVPGYVVTQEQVKGGDEGGGEEYWYVLKIARQSDGVVAYVRFEGYYQSHHGTEFDNPDEFAIVEPEMIQVRTWRTLKEGVTK